MTEKLALDIQNLSVSYKTDTAVVKAVNDLTFQLRTGKLLDWWEKQVQEKRLQP